MRRFHVWSLVLGVLLLAALLWSIGPGALWTELSELGWGLVPIILIQGVAEVFHTLGWAQCLSGSLRSLPFLEVFRIRMAGASINYLTPTASLGGELTKGALLSRNHPGPEAASGVIIGKLSQALAQLLFVVFGSLAVVRGIPLPAGVWPALLGGSVLLGAGIFGFLFVQRRGRLGSVVRWLSARGIGGTPLQKAALHVTEVDEALMLFYRNHPAGLPISVLWHGLGYLCGIAQSWYFLQLLTDRGSPVLAAGVWLLGSWLDLLGFAVPLDIGVLEGTRVLVFKALGFQAALGLTYGVALRLEQIFWAGAGLIAYAMMLRKRPTKGAPAVRNETSEHGGATGSETTPARVVRTADRSSRRVAGNGDRRC